MNLLEVENERVTPVSISYQLKCDKALGFKTILLNMDLQKRLCIQKASVLAGMLMAPSIVLAQANQYEPSLKPVDPQVSLDFWSMPRWVWLKRAGNGEEIKLEYWREGQLDPIAYQRISWFLRDLRFQTLLKSGSPLIHQALDSGRISKAELSPWMMMDPILLDILYAYSAWLRFYGVSRPVLVTSGLRHVLTNALTEGAARDSWHTSGGAADIVIEGVPSASVASFGRWLSGGGVGLYVQKNFVHVDRGRVRSWRG